MTPSRLSLDGRTIGAITKIADALDPWQTRQPVGVGLNTGTGRAMIVCNDGAVFVEDLEGWTEYNPVPGTRHERRRELETLAAERQRKMQQ